MRRLFQKRFSMVETVGLLVVAVLGVSVLGYAVSIPNTFTSGITISSSDVNANFTALADAINKKESGCTGNSANDIMVKVGPLCVDKYEASVWSNADGTGTQYGAASDNYPCSDPGNNCTGPDAIYAVSRVGVTPSRYITWFQAQQACALSGKRLLTNAEWQMAAAGTPDPGAADNGSTTCVTNSANQTTGHATTGSRSACVSNWGINDMVGNVWEWVADWIQGNTNPWAPPLNATAGTDYGSDSTTGTNPAENQGVNSTNFPSALIRGGNWFNGLSAGVFALLANDGASISANSIGFRCAR